MESRKFLNILCTTMLLGLTAASYGILAAEDKNADPGRLVKILKLDRLRQKAPNFQFQDFDGHSHPISSYFGHPLILHVWASWCTPCARELPQLVQLSSRLSGSGVAIVTIAVDQLNDREKVLRVLDQSLGKLPGGIAMDANAAKPYWAWGLPVTYFIDSGGRIIARAMGNRDWTTISYSDLADYFKTNK